jgi:hypothetical protein
VLSQGKPKPRSSAKASYPPVFFDAMRVKIRDEGMVRNKAVYIAVAASWTLLIVPLTDTTLLTWVLPVCWTSSRRPHNLLRSEEIARTESRVRIRVQCERRRQRLLDSLQCASVLSP